MYVINRYLTSLTKAAQTALHPLPGLTLLASYTLIYVQGSSIFLLVLKHGPRKLN